MKKIIFVICLLAIVQMPTLAINFGYYKAETEYGLIDGFKWNFFGREKGQPLVQIKSETKEEIERKEREKNRPKEVQDDVQLYRFMTEDTVAF